MQTLLPPGGRGEIKLAFLYAQNNNIFVNVLIFVFSYLILLFSYKNSILKPFALTSEENHALLQLKSQLCKYEYSGRNLSKHVITYWLKKNYLFTANAGFWKQVLCVFIYHSYLITDWQQILEKLIKAL